MEKIVIVICLLFGLLPIAQTSPNSYVDCVLIECG